MTEYKGLTIRIGGDTTSLNSALKSSTKSASVLQREIRQITRAMKLDPSSMANVETRMRLTTNRAESLNSKLLLVKRAMKELGSETGNIGGKAKSISEIAKSTDNIAYSAQAAKERYSQLTATLAGTYRELEKMASAKGIDVKLNVANRDDTITRKLRELEEISPELVAKARELRSAWHGVSEEMNALGKAQKLDSMRVDMQRIESEAKSLSETMVQLNQKSTVGRSLDPSQLDQTNAALKRCRESAEAYEAALRMDPSSVNAGIGRLKALSGELDLAETKARLLRKQMAEYSAAGIDRAAAGMKNVAAAAEKADAEYRQAAESASKLRGIVQELERRRGDARANGASWEEYNRLGVKVDAARAKLKELEAAERAAAKSADTAHACKEYQQLTEQVVKTDAKVKELGKRLRQKTLGNGNNSMLSASTLKSAGMTLYSTLTPAVTMLGWRAVTAAQDIDSAYRDMRKTVNGTETQFQDLRDAAIEFSQTHVTSADQVLEIQAMGGQLGVGAESLRDFSEAVSNIEVATDLDAETAATDLGQLANITHMTTGEYGRFADSLVRLGNNGASTESQIMDITKRIGSMASIVGISTPDMLALASSIASTGMNSEAAGTAISNTLSDMETAVAQGGDKLQKFADVAGMSAEEFADKWKNDPIVAFQEFVKGLNKVEQSGGSADAVLQGLGITGVRQKQAIEGLMQTIGGLDNNLQMSRDAWNGMTDEWGQAGDAANEASKKAEGFSGQLSILKNIGNAALSELAGGAVPWMKMITDAAQGAMEAFSGMGEGAKASVVGILAFSAGIGPALTGFSTLLTAKDNISKFIAESNGMSKAMKAIKAGAAEAGAGASLFTRAIGGMKGGIAALTPMLGALKFAGIAAGIAIVAAVIAKVSAEMKELDEHNRLVAESSRTFGTAQLEAASAARMQGDAVLSASDALAQSEGAMSGLNTVLKEMDDNLSQSREQWGKYYSNVSLADDYASTIGELMNRTGLTVAEQDKLKVAVAGYNKATGDSISITELENGKLADAAGKAIESRDALEQLVKAKEHDMRMSQLATDKINAENAARDASIQKQKAEAAFKDAQATYDDVASKYGGREAFESFVKSSMENGSILPKEVYDAVSAYENASKALDDASAASDNASRSFELMKEQEKLASDAMDENASAATKFTDNYSSMISAMLQDGQSLYGFRDALDDAGVSLDLLASLSEEDAGKVASSWDGTTTSLVDGFLDAGVQIGIIATQTDLLNQVTLDDKHYYVTDDNTVYNEKGKVLSFDTISISGKEYQVSDDNTIWENGKAIGTLEGKIANIQDGQFEIDGDNGPAEAATDEAVNYADGSDAEISVHANTNPFWNALGGIINTIVGHATVAVDGSAVGGYSRTPWDLGSAMRVPHMATGAIVTKPLLTNNGLVGEAGAEALMSWGTGGAVVPLTNRKYMLPIADAIADGMASRGGAGHGDVYSIGSITVNEDSAIAEATKRYIMELKRLAVM